jgi:hypothetical protein
LPNFNGFSLFSGSYENENLNKPAGILISTGRTGIITGMPLNTGANAAGKVRFHLFFDVCKTINVCNGPGFIAAANV